ncbi:MAG: CRISPR-associated CARF protein Csa3 [Candidatus Bathyarchaeia archaeon]
MKTTLIATLGFDEKFCYRAILRHGIKEGDEIILITAEKVEKVEKAYEWIKRLIQTSFSEKVNIRLFEVSVESPEEAIKRVVEIIKSVEGRIVVNLSGGMRALVAIVLIACIIADVNARIELEKEDFSGIVEFHSQLIKLIKSPPTGVEFEILKLIERGFKRVNEIAKELEKDESTIRRHLMGLTRDGLVEAEKKKPLVLKLTGLAKLFL